MRVLVALVALLPLAGCFGVGPSSPDDDATSERNGDEPGGPTVPAAYGGIPPHDQGEPGIYELSPEGLVKVETLSGLSWEEIKGGTRYAFDVREHLQPNHDFLFLVQGLEDQIVRASYDVDIPIEPVIGERPSSDVICLGVGLYGGWAEHGFYYERAAGRPGVPPATDAPSGGVIAHATAGPVDALVKLVGDRWMQSNQMDFRLHPGEFLRFDSGLSQYPPGATQAEGSQWWMNFTAPAAHRVLLIPASPLFCARGFAEFEGVQMVGAPPFEVARDGQRTVETRYGTFVALNVRTPAGSPEVDANPINSARVEMFGTTCAARAGQGVHRATFDAGEVVATLDQWQGHPWMIMTGLGPSQGPWTQPRFEGSCAP